MRLSFNPPPGLHRRIAYEERSLDGDITIMIPKEFNKSYTELSFYREDQVLELWPMPENDIQPSSARKGKGGPEPKHPWEEIAACYGWWRTAINHSPTPKQMKRAVEEIAKKLGVDIPDRRRIGEKVKTWERACMAYHHGDA
jgi:hypothetical protein